MFYISDSLNSHPLPWWQLCTHLAFSQPASPGMLFQPSWRSSYICWALVVWFSFTLRFDSSQTISLWLMSGIVEARSSQAALNHSPSWSNSPYTAWRCVGSLSWWKTNDSPTKRKPDGMEFRCRMLLNPCWLSVPWILNNSQTLSPAKHPHTITPPPPCFTVGNTHAEIIRSSHRISHRQRMEPKCVLRHSLDVFTIILQCRNE